MGSLCKLPNIIEGQKTLDYRTFYKSVDVAQILFVHNKTLENASAKTSEQLIAFAKAYNPVLEDQDFLKNLFQRQEIKKNVEE